MAPYITWCMGSLLCCDMFLATVPHSTQAAGPCPYAYDWPAGTHVQGVRLNHAIFASEEVILSRWGAQDGQKWPFKDSNVAAIMLTTPYRVFSDHPSLALFAQTLLPLVSPLACGLVYSTLRRKIPHVYLAPLNVGCMAPGLQSPEPFRGLLVPMDILFDLLQTAIN
jgi:hypothetical protein